MCTGSYAFKSFKPGVGVTAVVNPHYWNSSVKPLVKRALTLVQDVPGVLSAGRR